MTGRGRGRGRGRSRGGSRGGSSNSGRGTHHSSIGNEAQSNQAPMDQYATNSPQPMTSTSQPIISPTLNSSPNTSSSRVIHDTSAVPNTSPQPMTSTSRPIISPTLNSSPNTSSSRVIPDTSAVPNTSQPSTNLGEHNQPPAKKKKKKVRGLSRGLELDAYVAAHGKVRLVFEESLGRPSNGKHSSWLSSECGSIARRFTPQQIHSWSHISEEEFEALFERLKAKFIIDVNDDIAYRCVLATMGKAFGEMRYELGQEIRAYPNIEEARRHAPHTISQNDWDYLVKLFTSKEFQERSQRNSRNRKKLVYNHRGGSRPFVHHQQANSQGEIDLFKSTHWNEENGWIHDEAESRYVAMVELQNQPRPEGSQPLSEREITQEILGRRPGYVRGLGFGPRPTRNDYAESSRAAADRAEQEREHQATRDMVQAQHSRIEAQQTQIGQLQNGLAAILSLVRAGGIPIPESVVEQIGIPPLTPPNDPPPNDPQ